MDSDPRSPRAVWRRAFLCASCALTVVVFLAGMLEDLAHMAPHRPLAALSVLVALAGLPLFLSGLRVLAPGGIRTRRIGKWLKDPVSWIGVVGVPLYLSVVAAGFVVIERVPPLCRSYGSLQFGNGQFYMGISGTGSRFYDAYFNHRSPKQIGSLNIDLERMTAVDQLYGASKEPKPLGEAVETFAKRAGVSASSAQTIAAEVVDAVRDMQTTAGFKRLVSAGQVTYRPIEGAVLWLAVPVCFLGLVVFFYVITSWGAARLRRTGASRGR